MVAPKQPLYPLGPILSEARARRNLVKPPNTMSLPKVITVETSPSKYTLAFDVLEPTKVVIESQLNTEHGIAVPVRTMTITTEPVDEFAVPSLVDDATSSGIPSEDGQLIESENDATTSSGRSRSVDFDGSENYLLCTHRGRSVRSRTRPSAHSLNRSVSTTSSGGDEDVAAGASTTSRSESVIKKPTASAKRGSKGHRASLDQGGSGESSPNGDTDDSTGKNTRGRGRGSSRWSESQDALLRSMKEGGETWADIATALDRGKQEVRLRFKDIQAVNRRGSKVDRFTGRHNLRDKASFPKKTSKRHSQAHKKSTLDLSRRLGNHSTSATTDSTDSEAQQQMYLQDQIRENLYPPYLSLQEDDHFTKRDCAVLATVDSKMKRGKWLEMQANFFNVTGKMVPISVFRDKCEASEAEEREEIRERKIKSWKAGLDCSVQLDPNRPCQFEQHV